MKLEKSVLLTVEEILQEFDVIVKTEVKNKVVDLDHYRIYRKLFKSKKVICETASAE